MLDTYRSCTVAQLRVKYPILVQNADLAKDHNSDVKSALEDLQAEDPESNDFENVDEVKLKMAALKQALTEADVMSAADASATDA